MLLQHKVINMAQSGSTWISDCLGATEEEYGCSSAVTGRRLAANVPSLRQPGRLRHSGAGLRPAPDQRPALSSTRLEHPNREMQPNTGDRRRFDRELGVGPTT